MTVDATGDFTNDVAGWAFPLFAALRRLRLRHERLATFPVDLREILDRPGDHTADLQ